jgi:hypothetical protein
MVGLEIDVITIYPRCNEFSWVWGVICGAIGALGAACEAVN